MSHIAVIGAGITGVTTAYKLQQHGYRVTVIDRNAYAAMDTSFANGGQLSASNAEVWNQAGTLLKGLKWLFRNDAPLSLSLRPGWHKYSWLARFIGDMRHYRSNTIETTRLAIAARAHLFDMASQEGIEFDLEKRGILHVYYSASEFSAASKANVLLQKGGLERYAVTPAEIRTIEPTLKGQYYGGFYTPSDATGDIHKFTTGLARACQKRGVQFLYNTEIDTIHTSRDGIAINWHDCHPGHQQPSHQQLQADAVVVCAGIGSRGLARQLGDHVNVYPVKGYSITVQLDNETSQQQAPWVSLLDESAKIVTSRLGLGRLRVAGTAEFNGDNRDIRHDRIQPLLNWVRCHFAVDTETVVPWAGLRPMMPDMMPKVGAGRQPGVFYNTGHGHLGWTLSGITAQMVTEAVMARTAQ